MNALPEVKRFLKESGNADHYPIEIFWKPGHDPELQIRRCSGSPPSKQSDREVEVLKSFDLSPYTLEQLHWLAQCEGLAPDGPIPQVEVLEPLQACERLPPPGVFPGLTSMLTHGLTLLCVGAFVCLSMCCRLIGCRATMAALFPPDRCLWAPSACRRLLHAGTTEHGTARRKRNDRPAPDDLGVPQEDIDEEML